MHRDRRPRLAGPFGVLAPGAVALALLAGCGGAGDTRHSVPASTAAATSAAGRTTDPTHEATSSTTAPTTAAAPSTSAGTTPTCVSRLVASLTPAQKAGQLLWVGLDANAGRSALDAQIADQHVGGVVLLGGWTGSDRVSATTAHLHDQVSRAATGGLGLFVTADQEGGQIQQLKGAGYSTIPSARQQDASSPAGLRTAAKAWAGELAASGVNVNLAPVADTVPTSLGAANQPIGRWHRNFSSDPADNARMVAAFIGGMHDGGVAATVKHFPGLGRVTGNTDVTRTGITDTRTTTTDAYLAPFAAGIRAGTDFVMISSATYTRIDKANPAVFSRAVVTGLLRQKMGWAGVVVTDDVGVAASVADVPAGERATRVIGAGGDIVLTADPALTGAMTRALTDRAAADSGFAAKVDAAVTRVVTLKAARGLAGTCR